MPQGLNDMFICDLILSDWHTRRIITSCNWTFVIQALLYTTQNHYSDVIMGAMASEITSVSIVYSNICWGTDQRKHQSTASLAFVRRIHRWPVNSPHNRPVTRKMAPFDDVIMTHVWNRHSVCWADSRHLSYSRTDNTGYPVPGWHKPRFRRSCQAEHHPTRQSCLAIQIQIQDIFIEDST